MDGQIGEKQSPSLSEIATSLRSSPGITPGVNPCPGQGQTGE